MRRRNGGRSTEQQPSVIETGLRRAGHTKHLDSSWLPFAAGSFHGNRGIVIKTDPVRISLIAYRLEPVHSLRGARRNLKIHAAVCAEISAELPHGFAVERISNVHLGPPDPCDLY